MSAPFEPPPTRQRPPRPRRTWAASAAATFALVSAVPSVYWGLGGTVGLDTLGGRIEELARAHDPQILLVVWVAVALKVAGAGVALALGRPWRGRRALLLLAGAGGALLTVYGAVLTGASLLVVTGFIASNASTDRTALYGHLLLWDPIFLVWGLLLGLAAWQCRGPRRRRG